MANGRGGAVRKLSEEFGGKERKEAEKEGKVKGDGCKEGNGEDGWEFASLENVGRGRVWVVVGTSGEYGICDFLGEEQLHSQREEV